MINIKTMWLFMGISIIAVCMEGYAIQVHAETLNYKFVTWQIKAESAPTFDVPEHVILLGSRGALYFFEDGDVATVTSTTVGDMNNWKGPFWQYTHIKFADDSTMVIKSEGYYGSDSGSWKSEIIKGTGRFEGAKGTHNAKGNFFPIEKGEPGSRGYGGGSIMYTLPSK